MLNLNFELALTVQPNHWTTVQGLAMRLRSLVRAVHELEQGKGRIVSRLRAEAALRGLEADLVSHADRLTEELLWARMPKKVSTPPPSGDIPDLTGLA